jgi:serine protease AprX
MTYPLGTFFRIRWSISASAALAALLTLVAIHSASFGMGQTSLALEGGETAASGADANLTALAAEHPRKAVEVIVRLEPGADRAQAQGVVQAAGGKVTRDLHIINALGARMSAGAAEELAASPEVLAVSLNRVVKPTSVDTSRLVTAYPESVYAERFWAAEGSLGTGVGVAVIDTGIQGDRPDFRTSQSNSRSRVIASAVVNPAATTAADKYGHGTHVAGMIGGNGLARSSSDSLYGKYIGIAPEANLISVKASDDQGKVSTIDVIDGLQFVVDHKDDLNIRVVNLSLSENEPESYRTSALDAAAEQAWFAGIVVVAAAGNRGTAEDAVDYAPGNDPFVITVGAVDDQGTGNPNDDTAAAWSSRGTTQDGYVKPNFSAPGAHMVSTLSPGSAITGLCSQCVVDGQYFRMGGTSMSTAVVSGAVAALVGDHPDWTPNQVKSAIGANLRYVAGTGYELNLYSADGTSRSKLSKPNDYPLNEVIDPATGQIDYTRSSWSRSSWSTASSSLKAGWARSSWSCVSCKTDTTAATPTRSSWSRSSWSRSSWSMSFTK